MRWVPGSQYCACDPLLGCISRLPCWSLCGTCPSLLRSPLPLQLTSKAGGALACTTFSSSHPPALP